jgi:hypothetical protein
MAESRRWDGEPETDADRRFLDLRDSGYTGPINQDGYACDDPDGVFDALAEATERAGRAER